MNEVLWIFFLGACVMAMLHKGYRILAVIALSSMIAWLSWQNVRQNYPDESKQPPCKHLTFVGAYRLMWLD